MIDTYTKYNRRITPALLTDTIYSLAHYDEWRRVVDDYNALCLEALQLYYLLRPVRRAAFDQLVLFPIQACANIYNMYYAVAMNRSLAQKGDSEAHVWAARVHACFARAALLTNYYNTILCDGKWNHLMYQTHIGYTSWQEPPQNIPPSVALVDSRAPRAPYLFADHDGYLSMEAEHYCRCAAGAATHWVTIPTRGRTLSALPTAPCTAVPASAMCVEYAFTTPVVGAVTVLARFCPTLNGDDGAGQRYAISLDDAPAQVVNINGAYNGALGLWQAEHVITSAPPPTRAARAQHVLRLRAPRPRARAAEDNDRLRRSAALVVTPARDFLPLRRWYMINFSYLCATKRLTTTITTIWKH